MYGQPRSKYKRVAILRHSSRMPASKRRVLAQFDHNEKEYNEFVLGKHVVFGKILRGYAEVIQKLAEVPVDSKDRPTKPILIANCGELELRKKPASEAPVETKSKFKPSPSPEENEKSPPPRRKRSPSVNSEKDRTRKKKKPKQKRRSSSPVAAKSDFQVPTEETEEEYDARLEREELERMELARKEELKRIREKYEETQSKMEGGVRFKGMCSIQFTMFGH